MLVATEPRFRLERSGIRMDGSWVEGSCFSPRLSPRLVESRRFYKNSRMTGPDLPCQAAVESGSDSSDSESTDIRESKRAKNILDSICSCGNIVRNE